MYKLCETISKYLTEEIRENDKIEYGIGVYQTKKKN